MEIPIHSEDFSNLLWLFYKRKFKIFKLGWNLANGYEMNMIIIFVFQGHLNKSVYIELQHTFVLMSPFNPNKYDDFHTHMDYVILYEFKEGK